MTVEYHEPCLAVRWRLRSDRGAEHAIAAVDRWRIPGVVFRELDRSIRTTDLSLVWNGATRNEAVDLLLEVADSVSPRST